MGLRADPNNSLQDITNIINIPKSIIRAINQRGMGINKPQETVFTRCTSNYKIYSTNKSTCRITLTRLKKLFLFHIHENTIRNALQKAGYHHRIARRRPYLNKRDRKRRLKFAKEHKNWTTEDWARVLFSDEMAIKLFMERHTRDYVWRKTDEALHPDCINYEKRPQGTGLMFWGVFRKGRMGPGVFFDLEKGEKVDSTIYRDQILLGPLQQFWEESFEDIKQSIVMKDNALVHKKICIPAREALGMITLD